MKGKRWEKICHANSNHERSGVATLTSDKIELQEIKRHFIMRKRSMHQVDRTMINIHATTEHQNT